MITIKDIAQRAGVSYATVSRALNGRPDVSEATRQRVFELAREMGYQPNAIARSLVKQKSQIIAVIVPDVSNPFFADITMAVNEAADAAGYTTMICNTGWDPVKEQEKLRIMVEQRVEGIILKPTAFIKPGSLESLNLPLVLLWHAMEDNLSYIEVDHEAGSHLALLHLLDQGYRRIAYIGGSESSPANQIRLVTYQKTLAAEGLELDEKLISYGPFLQESGYTRLAGLMQSAQPPDAVFCGSDIIAMGALQYAREKAIRVPQDLAIMGFDDITCASLPLVGLSTVSQPRDKLGQAAFTCLMQEINAYPKRTKQRLLVQPELKARTTT